MVTNEHWEGLFVAVAEGRNILTLFVVIQHCLLVISYLPGFLVEQLLHNFNAT